jgi:hypothetical protein
MKYFSMRGIDSRQHSVSPRRVGKSNMHPGTTSGWGFKQNDMGQVVPAL